MIKVSKSLCVKAAQINEFVWIVPVWIPVMVLVFS